MKMLLDRAEVDSPHGRLSLGILIFQDLCVVPLMLLVPILGGGGEFCSTLLDLAQISRHPLRRLFWCAVAHAPISFTKSFTP